MKLKTWKHQKDCNKETIKQILISYVTMILSKNTLTIQRWIEQFQTGQQPDLLHSKLLVKFSLADDFIQENQTFSSAISLSRVAISRDSAASAISSLYLWNDSCTSLDSCYIQTCWHTHTGFIHTSQHYFPWLCRAKNHQISGSLITHVMHL